MKKLFLALALVGMVGSVSATAVSALGTDASVVVSFDKGKKKDKKKKDACCEKKSADGAKSCSKEGDKKAGCCKDKQKAEAAPAPAPAQ